MNTRNYLKVTVHDNDFIHPLLKAVGVLYDICYENDRYPDETDLEDIRIFINHLCFNIKQISDHFEWDITTSEHLLEYLMPDICIIDGSDIPEWDNAESVYMPLFDTDDEIFFR